VQTLQSSCRVAPRPALIARRAPGRWSAVRRLRPVLAELSVQPESAHRVTQAHGDLHDVSHEFAHTAYTHPALFESKREQQPFI